MEFLFESYWLYALVGLFVGAAAATSGIFREGAGLVLLFGIVIAIIAAAVLGAFTPMLPAAIAAITGRVALLCICFAGAAICADKRR